MQPESVRSPADILAEVVEPNRPTLSRNVAEELLSLRFNDDALTRIRSLLSRNNAGTITSTERTTLDNYLHMGELLDLLQAKARLTLSGPPSQAT